MALDQSALSSSLMVQCADGGDLMRKLLETMLESLVDAQAAPPPRRTHLAPTTEPRAPPPAQDLGADLKSAPNPPLNGRSTGTPPRRCGRPPRLPAPHTRAAPRRA
jgi:hypothetical protein